SLTMLAIQRSVVHTQLICVLLLLVLRFSFFNDTATTEIYTLSLHDALPISVVGALEGDRGAECRFLGGGCARGGGDGFVSTACCDDHRGREECNRQAVSGHDVPCLGGSMPPLVLISGSAGASFLLHRIARVGHRSGGPPARVHR